MIKINEVSYSRIYQHTQDDSTFAIIGSEDKDTGESRFSELNNLIRKYTKKTGKRIGFNKVDGMYTYQVNGKEKAIAYEDSLILYDIDKELALEIANDINQESIVWKDKNFFGIIYANGDVMTEFDNKPGQNMSFSNAEKSGFGTKLPKDKNSDYGFTFEGKVYYPNIKTKEYEIENFVFTKN